MKKKRFIPLLLVLTLSTSALSFGPTWGKPVTESGDSFLSGGKRRNGIFRNKQQYGFRTL